MNDAVYPHSEEAEKAVLGAILFDPLRLDDLDFLESADFYLIKHQWLWDIYRLMVDRGESVDEITVAAELKTQHKFDDFGGQSYLTDLINSVASFQNIMIYGELVKRCAKRRAIISAASEIANLAVNSTGTLEDITDQAEAILYGVTHFVGGREDMSLRTAIGEYFDEVEKRYNDGGYAGIPTGFSEYDALTNGLRNGELTLVGARPSMGKTSLLLNMAYNIAEKGYKPLFLSFEMTVEALCNRLMSLVSGMDSNLIDAGKFRPEHWEKMVDGTTKLGEMPFYLRYCSGITLTTVRSICNRQKRSTGLDVLIVDYLGLINPGGKVTNQNQAISDLSRGLKMLAGELNVPVVVASQLSRDLKDRTDKRPQLWDLRDSGSLEQDADNVLFVHRPDYYVAADRPGIAELILAKQRNGPIGMFNLEFKKALTKFVNAAPRPASIPTWRDN